MEVWIDANAGVGLKADKRALWFWCDVDGEIGVFGGADGVQGVATWVEHYLINLHVREDISQAGGLSGGLGINEGAVAVKVLHGFLVKVGHEHLERRLVLVVVSRLWLAARDEKEVVVVTGENRSQNGS